jgi:hypothetical protein
MRIFIACSLLIMVLVIDGTSTTVTAVETRVELLSSLSVFMLYGNSWFFIRVKCN